MAELVVTGELRYDWLGLLVYLDLGRGYEIPPMGHSLSVSRLSDAGKPIGVWVYLRDLWRITLPDGAEACQETRELLLRGEHIVGTFRLTLPD